MTNNNVSNNQTTWTDGTTTNNQNIWFDWPPNTDHDISLPIIREVIVEHLVEKEKEVKKLDIKTFKEFKNLSSDEKAMFILENPNVSTKLLVLWLKQLEAKLAK